jgi:4-amino-4-deoxy-L-arabinose transferase-like glycosyltransferase
MRPPTTRSRRLSEHSRRLFAYLFLAAALGLIPWTLYLAYSLPSRHVQDDFYEVGWAGFDVLLAALLGVTGYGLLRRRVWVQATAASAATILVVDAWFDVLSSSRHGERLVALLLAVFAELPTAVVCVVIASDAEAAAERATRYLRLRRGRERQEEVISEP